MPRSDQRIIDAIVVTYPETDQEQAEVVWEDGSLERGDRNDERMLALFAKARREGVVPHVARRTEAGRPTNVPANPLDARRALNDALRRFRSHVAAERLSAARRVDAVLARYPYMMNDQVPYDVHGLVQDVLGRRVPGREPVLERVDEPRGEPRTARELDDDIERYVEQTRPGHPAPSRDDLPTAPRGDPTRELPSAPGRGARTTRRTSAGSAAAPRPKKIAKDIEAAVRAAQLYIGKGLTMRVTDEQKLYDRMNQRIAAVARRRGMDESDAYSQIVNEAKRRGGLQAIPGKDI